MAQVLIGCVSAVDMEMRLTAQCWISLAAFRAVIVVMILGAKLGNSFRRLGYAANPVHNHAVVTGMKHERCVHQEIDAHCCFAGRASLAQWQDLREFVPFTPVTLSTRSCYIGCFV